MRLVDTHCHLDDEEGIPDPAAAVERAAEAGVDRIIAIGIDAETSRRSVDLADRFPGVYATVGWHPTSVDSFQTGTSIALLRELAQHPKVVAIGEIGLDNHWHKTSLEEQIPALHEQLDLALELDLPVVLHCRDASDALLDLLEAKACPRLSFHCFAGDAGHAARALALGAYLGVDGPLTYKKSQVLRDLFASLPGDRILVETDAPWLSPEPVRGRRNEPANVAWVNRKLAEIRGISELECAALTTANAKAFFRFPGRSA